MKSRSTILIWSVALVLGAIGCALSVNRNATSQHARPQQAESPQAVENHDLSKAGATSAPERAKTEAKTPGVADKADDPTSEMGPMIDSANANRVDAIVREAESYASVIVRGGAVDPSSAYSHPSLIEVDDPMTPIVQQEVFEPVATFEIFDTEADAIRLANITDYGLAASVGSRDVDRPRRVASKLHAGTVWANAWQLS